MPTNSFLYNNSRFTPNIDTSHAQTLYGKRRGDSNNYTTSTRGDWEGYNPIGYRIPTSRQGVYVDIPTDIANKIGFGGFGGGSGGNSPATQAMQQTQNLPQLSSGGYWGGSPNFGGMISAAYGFGDNPEVKKQVETEGLSSQGLLNNLGASSLLKRLYGGK